ncbi:ABC transporter permease [Peristeroidobacter soli]|uniref:ABC transporter permease n=1 Tax=Peristeroidobacter soli TaxID=2497877 RepID=UPI00101B9B8B|nr:ABC transporter permease [Peristeroidobacter soli]
MLFYFFRRLGRALVTIVGISVIVFVVARLSGDPTLQLAPEDATPEELAQIRSELGLDKPIWMQYVVFVEHVAQGDFGTSIRYQQPALSLVLSVLPATLQLGLSAFVLSTIVGVLLGVVTALKRDTWIDSGLRGVVVVGQAAPSFWLGMMLILLFSVELQWLPSSGRMSLAHMVLPTMALALSSVAVVLRLTRSAMLETMSADYIRFLRSKGMSKSLIVWKHALRNASIPVIAVLGLQLSYLIGGAVIVETVFNWPGVGRLMVEALNARDFAVIQAGALLVSFFTVGANLLVDLLFGLVDPRIRYE